MICTQRERDFASLGTHIYGDELASSAGACGLHTLDAHAALAKDGDGIARPDLRGLDSGDAVAQRLQGGGLAVGDAVIDLDQRDGREQGALGKTAGQLEADDWAAAAVVATLGVA